MQDNLTPYGGNLWANYTSENIVELWKQKVQEFQASQGDTSFHSLTASVWNVGDEHYVQDELEELFWENENVFQYSDNEYNTEY